MTTDVDVGMELQSCTDPKLSVPTHVGTMPVCIHMPYSGSNDTSNSYYVYQMGKNYEKKTKKKEKPKKKNEKTKTP